MSNSESDEEAGLLEEEEEENNQQYPYVCSLQEEVHEKFIFSGKGHTLYLDNSYTSPRLVDKLVKSKSDCVGTMSSYRKEFPQTVKLAKLKQGEITAAFCGKQMVMKWKDKREVLMVSTFHGTEMCEVEKEGKNS
ncbi:hypothetical protein J437_LFUL006436 [Ladona fulva]|uniref:PiggyBac transposable element-derived protein domain-containing protein n=1 Tax=Ladona fulva TaxID=123851 RepID=A0A8K0JZ57_LADFU|nr:hypothetical protein J437_LFUL006436 [Ladona fulva]